MGAAKAWRRGTAPNHYKRKVNDMKDCREILEFVMTKLEDHYREYGDGRDLTYTYGFFDAVAVVRDMISEVPPSDMK